MVKTTCWQVLNSSSILGNKIISFYRHHSVLFLFFFPLHSCVHILNDAKTHHQSNHNALFFNNIDTRFIQAFNDARLANVTRYIIIIITTTIIFSKFMIFLHFQKIYIAFFVICSVRVRVCVCFFYACHFKTTSSTEQKPSHKDISFSSYLCLSACNL